MSARGESLATSWVPDAHVANSSDAPKDECGVFGVYSPGEDVARIAYFGLFALQHRGQESAGIATANGERIKAHAAMGLVTQVFDEQLLRDLGGAHIALGHTRYSTTGASDICNAQPIVRSSSVGDLAVAHNGNLVNAHVLRNRLEREGVEFQSTSDSEVIAVMLARAMNGSIESALKEVLPQLKGAYSLGIMTPTQLIAVRDPHGVRPLCVGQIGPNRYVVSSESCAVGVVGAHFIREVEPGEAIIIDADGLREAQIVPLQRHAVCLFEFIYFARPDSHIYSQTIYDTRKRMGHELAQEHPAEADVVIPIPDSAVPAALGYSEASGIRFAEGLVKNRYIQRTFIDPDQRMRDLGARMKYSPLTNMIAGRRVVMVDDSIVRGTTTDKLVRMLIDAGAREVHVRITSPPVRFPCFYGIDMAKQEDLIAANYSVDEIRQRIGATSLGYLSLPAVIRAVRKPGSLFCRACFDGHYPIEIPGDVRLQKMMLERARANGQRGSDGSSGTES